MIDASGIDIIARQIVRDGRSLLQYVGEAFPYVPARAEQARYRFEALGREQQAAVGRLVRFLQRHHATPPVLGAFPSVFTTINFVALDHLMAPLQEEEQSAIADLERQLASLPEGDARTLLADYLDMKRRHLQELKAIAHIEQEAERGHPSVIPAGEAAPAH